MSQMNQFSNYKTNIKPKYKTILPNLEIETIVKRYETFKLQETNNLLENPIRQSHSHRQNETCIDILDKIDREIIGRNDKLISNLKLETVEFDRIGKKGPKTELFKEKKSIIFVTQEKTPVKMETNLNKSNELLSKSVNISPIRIKNNETIGESQTALVNKKKEFNCKRSNIKLQNITKFINKPKSPGKNTKATSRSSSVSNNNNKSTNALLNQNKPRLSTNSKRAVMSFPSVNARNNDKILVDLQTMFGRKVEYFEGITTQYLIYILNTIEMYPNLNEEDKKHLIEVLLSISFDFKNEYKEEKFKNGIYISYYI